MVVKSRIKLQVIITVIFLFIPIFAGAVNFSQIITLEKDGSGVLKLMYSEKEAVVKAKNFVVGNLPFEKEKSEEYFKSDNTFIKAITIEKNPNDNSIIEVNVSIGFNNINKINEMKALPNAQLSFAKSDSGNDFKYVITPAFTKSNFLDNVFTILTYDGKLKYTNGDTTNKAVKWFRNKENLNIKDIILLATYEPDAKSSPKTSNDKEKSCGLFGFEFPVLLLGGMIFSYSMKGLKKRKK